MRIGEVAQKSGFSAATIRFYEAEGLIAKANRSSSGYRAYSSRVFDELMFISRAQRLGLTLGETREILKLGRAGKRPCATVAAICEKHLGEIDRRMDELRAFRDNLQQAKTLAERDCGFTTEGFCRAIFSGQTGDGK